MEIKKIYNIIFLDIDGVLINTFPIWKPDELAEDGHSKFNPTCTNNLIQLLNTYPNIRLVISSSRRVGKSLEKLESIFSFRGIKNKIIDKIPDPKEIHHSREVEISNYIEKHHIKNFIIIDDDKALLKISKQYLDNLILTNYRDGFDKESLEKASSVIATWK